MRQTILLVLTLLTISTEAQYKCGDRKLPTSTQLYLNLLQKPVTINPRKFLVGCNVNDSVKRRLQYLLDWNWSKEEIYGFLNQNLKNAEAVYRIEERAKEMSYGNDSLFRNISDSLRNKINSEVLIQMKADNLFSVDVSVILTIAFLNMKQAEKELRVALNDPVHYPKWAVELALARLGDKELQTKIINESVPDFAMDNFAWIDDFTLKARKLILIGTQQSFFVLQNWIETTKTVEGVAGKPFEKAGYRVINYLRDFILNRDFQELIRPIPLDGSCPCDTRLILEVKDWLEKNKGRYLLNLKLYPW